MHGSENGHGTCRSTSSTLRLFGSRSPRPDVSFIWDVSDTAVPDLGTVLAFATLAFFLTITPLSLSLSFFTPFTLALALEAAEEELPDVADEEGACFGWEVATKGGLDTSLCRAATALKG
jgi:hypothetical protein